MTFKANVSTVEYKAKTSNANSYASGFGHDNPSAFSMSGMAGGNQVSYTSGLAPSGNSGA